MGVREGSLSNKKSLMQVRGRLMVQGQEGKMQCRADS